MELTILMPCLNEAETLATCIDKAKGFLAQHQVSGEVLIADNGSTDGSIDIAEAHGARVVHVPVRGYGAALKAGIEAAEGQFVIMGDSDDSYDFSRLELYLDELRAGTQLVMGNRFRGGIAPGAMPFLHKYLGNPVLSFLARLCFRIPIGDFHCGLRGFDRRAMLAVAPSTPGMEFATEMVVKASLGGLSIAEVPTTLSRDGRSRPPHLNTWRDGWRHLRFILLFSPRWLFLYPSVFVLVFGLLLTLLLVPGEVALTDEIRLDIHTQVAASFITLFGVQGLCFALLARYYTAVRGILPDSQLVSRTLKWLSLEKVLLFSGALILVGLGGFAYAVGQWVASSLGPLEYGSLVRALVLSGTSIAVALQVALTGFMIAVIDIGDGSGD